MTRQDRTENEDVASHATTLLRIPVAGHADVALLQSVLRSAGFYFHVALGFGETSDIVSIRQEDLPRVKAFLRDFRTHDVSGNQVGIPW